MTADDVGFIECDPVFHSIAEEGETELGVVDEVGDYIAGEESSVSLLESQWEIPVI